SDGARPKAPGRCRVVLADTVQGVEQQCGRSEASHKQQSKSNACTHRSPVWCKEDGSQQHSRSRDGSLGAERFADADVVCEQEVFEHDVAVGGIKAHEQNDGAEKRYAVTAEDQIHYGAEEIGHATEAVDAIAIGVN